MAEAAPNLHPRFTPAAVWRMLWGGASLPNAATWEQLLGGATIGQLRGAIGRARPAGRRGAASWNVRWLGGPNRAMPAAK
eukprot:3389569-Lingulodinium_polyedra.AAC.1